MLFLTILLILVLFIKLFQYKYDNFEGNCIKPIHNNIQFSLTKNKLKQFFDTYGDKPEQIEQIIQFYMIRDLSDNINFNDLFLNTDGSVIDPLNDTQFKLYTPETCHIKYL
jgi:hypothetical protein